MIDPNDPGTLDLIEACQRPLTNAERQKTFRARQRAKKAALKSEDVRTVQLSARDRGYLGSALDYYDFNQYGGTYTGQFVKANLLDLYRRIDPPHRDTAAWPLDEDRSAWYSKQVWHAICDSNKAKLVRAEAEAQAARDELAQARAEVARLQTALQQIAAEVGAPLPVRPPVAVVARQSAAPVPPEAFSLELMRSHKWANGREEDVALVGIQVVPHEGQWLWAASLCASNGAGYHYAPLPKWERFAATAEDALREATSEVREFMPRAAPAEQKRIATWLAGEVAGCLAQLANSGQALPVTVE